MAQCPKKLRLTRTEHDVLVLTDRYNRQCISLGEQRGTYRSLESLGCIFIYPMGQMLYMVGTTAMGRAYLKAHTRGKK